MYHLPFHSNGCFGSSSLTHVANSKRPVGEVDGTAFTSSNEICANKRLRSLLHSSVNIDNESSNGPTTTAIRALIQSSLAMNHLSAGIAPQMKQFAPSTTTANLQRPSIVLDRHFGLATTPSVYFGDSHNTPISSFVGLGNSGPFAHDQQQVQLYLYVRNLQQQQQLLRQMSMQDPVIVPTAMRQTGSLSHSVVDSQVTDVPTKEADPLSVLLESDQALTVLPAILAATEDVKQLSNHQVLLRRQVEAFVATEEHVSTHSRGRTKPVRLGQVGIRCRHCAHMPLMNQKKGSVYFPSTFHGISQASQNMNFMHFDVSEGGKGICSAMPSVIVAEFATVFATKVSASRAGRSYWSSSAEQMGLVDTDHGIFVGNQLPSDLQPLEAPKKYNRVIPTCSATLATPKH